MKTTSLDTRIDDLYRLPLDQFIPARTQLAKELKGDEAKRVKQLKKPTGVPWAVNQVHWHAQPLFERVLKAGADVRHAQVAALEGRKADVRAAGEAHRQSIAEAVVKATELAGAHGIQPARDELTQTFEAISLAAEPSGTPGRLTQSLRPGGFEMLAGVTPAARVASAGTRPTSEETALRKPPTTPRSPSQDGSRHGKGRPAEGAVRDLVAERKAAEAARQREAEIKKAEVTVARAREREAQARDALDEAVRERQAAEQRLAAAKVT